MWTSLCALSDFIFMCCYIVHQTKLPDYDVNKLQPKHHLIGTQHHVSLPVLVLVQILSDVWEEWRHRCEEGWYDSGLGLGWSKVCVVCLCCCLLLCAVILTANRDMTMMKYSVLQSVVDASTVYLYRRHKLTTLQKNLHLNQKGVMNQLLASIWLMNDLRLIWIQSVSMCSQFCRSQSNTIYTAYGVKL